MYTLLFFLVSNSIKHNHAKLKDPVACTKPCLENFATSVRSKIVNFNGHAALSPEKFWTAMLFEHTRELERNQLRHERKKFEAICEEYQVMSTCAKDHCAEDTHSELLQGRWSMIDYICHTKYSDYKRNLECIRQAEYKSRLACNEMQKMNEDKFIDELFAVDQLSKMQVKIGEYCRSFKQDAQCFMSKMGMECGRETGHIIEMLFRLQFRNFLAMFEQFSSELKLLANDCTPLVADWEKWLGNQMQSTSVANRGRSLTSGDQHMSDNSPRRSPPLVNSFHVPPEVREPKTPGNTTRPRHALWIFLLLLLLKLCT